MIRLCCLNTPNSHKISIALEELSLPYELEAVDVRPGVGESAWFNALNPNGKTPVIVDTETGTTIFESCAILLYLSSKANRLMPSSPNERWEALQWLFFQGASLEPMLGQLAWFSYYSGEPVPHAINRYSAEVERLYSVIDGRLANQEFFCTDYSIVDIAHYGWINCANKMHLDFSKWRHITRWYEAVGARPAVQRGLAIPAPLPSWDASHRMIAVNN